MNVDWNTVSAASTAATALFAAWAANETRRAAKIAERAAEAQLLYEFMREYDQYEMADALRLLRSLACKPNFANDWIHAFRNGDVDAKNVDKARRRVFKHFQRGVRLQNAGLISKNGLKTVADQAGINVYFDVVHCLNLALNPNGQDRTTLVLSKLCPRRTDAETIPVIPDAPSKIVLPASS